jgi:predicted PolB exonuclease-like 3'-5' exonuclease
VPDPDLPAPPKKRGSKKGGGDSFPPIPCHRIVAIGAALLDAFGRLRRIWIVGEDSDGTELNMLTALVTWLNLQLAQRTGLVLAGWNTRGFDLPVIMARCLRYGLAFPWYYEPHGARYRYGDRHLDVMDFLADHRATKSFSLDLAAKLIGMPGKLDCTGASVAKMIAEGRLEEVRAYCLQDVAQTVAVLLRVQLLRGELDHEGYVAAMEGLLRAIDREPRLAPMLPLIDRERLMSAAIQSAPTVNGSENRPLRAAS